MSSFNYHKSLTDVSWTSSEPLSKSDIDKMRQEFWDTASAYEGYKDTWDLLRKCVNHIHNGESYIAEEMLLLNGIIIPEGTLTECYNELGYKFEIPNYVLSYPSNMQTQEHIQQSEASRACGAYFNTVLVRLSDMRMFTIPVAPNDTIGILKSKLEEPCKVQVCDQRWYFGGQVLRNEVLLRKYNIDNTKIIQVIIHKPKCPNYLN